ncbi:MAG: hypothetical protein KatS3mg030_658 [Saprospiraceae bacterium]|nr:MAG: hypothetical protein KatS3mg029_0217 [Saprospiraceae bacterium]GIV32356.1 MAG: hypothetical protein KatS3mg030_658 [Saprospiraceae bacterium]
MKTIYILLFVRTEVLGPMVDSLSNSNTATSGGWM